VVSIRLAIAFSLSCGAGETDCRPRRSAATCAMLVIPAILARTREQPANCSLSVQRNNWENHKMIRTLIIAAGIAATAIGAAQTANAEPFF
jgi:hypothetical protein